MNLSASRCGSGCESGWTFYLDQSFSSQTWSGVNGARFMAEDEEEGLSMVSDASSGPRPCYCQDYAECPDENGSFCSHPATPEQPKNIKKKASTELSDFSQGFSGTHFKGKSAFQKELGFLKSGKTSYQHAGGFQERSRE
ncbi:hypothetical protein V6N11_017883 [Hibiscus sabdariffa]|uniref:Uncharacterized protein n=1 Tax=Hibiscus sabdariffa TaxID=183260 RepID=A0ABR2T6E4_9ROSI